MGDIIDKKIPRLFYYEETVNAWCPAPEKIENIVDLSMLADGEECDSVRFMRQDMTDEEFENMPED